MPVDPRFKTARWRKLRAHVIARDGPHCAIPGCTTDMSQPRQIQVDHIIEVKDHQTEAEFWNPNGLQVLCRTHNVWKGIAAKTRREDQPPPQSPNA